MTQLDFSDLPEQPASRATDPVTSALAAVAPGRSRGKRAVLRCLHQHGPMHDEKIARLTGLRLGSASKRRHDLQAMGLVDVASLGGQAVTAHTTSGHAALVWRLTPAGRAVALQLPPEADDAAAAEARRADREARRVSDALAVLSDYIDQQLEAGHLTGTDKTQVVNAYEILRGAHRQ